MQNRCHIYKAGPKWIKSVLIRTALCPDHTTPEEFDSENTSNDFRTKQEKFRNPTITGHFRFVFENTWAGHRFHESFAFNTISVHAKTKGSRFQIPPRVEKRFRDGLVWTVGLTVVSRILLVY